jgi:hypothetical protein
MSTVSMSGPVVVAISEVEPGSFVVLEDPADEEDDSVSDVLSVVAVDSDVEPEVDSEPEPELELELDSEAEPPTPLSVKQPVTQRATARVVSRRGRRPASAAERCERALTSASIVPQVRARSALKRRISGTSR